MRRSSLFLTLALYGAIAVLGGCGGSGGSQAIPPTTAPAGPTALKLTQAGGPVVLPTAGGYAGILQLPTNNAPSGTTISIAAATAAPVGAPTPQALHRTHDLRSPQATLAPTVLFVVTIQVSQSVTFTSTPSFSIQLPAGMSTVNEAFYIAIFSGESAQSPLLTSLGPATISGSTITFAGSATPLTFDAGVTYLIELYEVATGPTATPSPLPSSSPSASPSATPTATPTVAPTATPTVAPTATPTVAPTATPTVAPTATPTAAPAPTAGTLYALSQTSSFTFAAFAPGANGNVAPTASFNASIQSPTGIAVDATGRAYVVAYTQSGTAIYSYAYGASGNASPSTTLTTDIHAWALGIDPLTDDLVATDANNNIVEYFAPAATGSASPVKTISGSSTGLNFPYQVAFDGSDNIYVVNGNGYGSVVEYAAGASGNATPIATISGNLTGLDGPEALAVDSTGRIYVGNSVNNTITVYPPGSNGNVAPSAVLQGGTYDFLIDQALIAIDGSNNLYVFGRSSEVEVFAPVTGSPQAPIRTITGSATGLSYAMGVAIVP